MIYIAAFLSALSLQAAFAQPAITNGTSIALYHNDSTASYLLVGVDIQTGAMLFSSSFSDESTLRSSSGSTYRLRTGESQFSTYDSDRVQTAEQLSDHFPFLTLNALNKIDTSRVNITTNEDGSKVFDARLVIGNLGLTSRGYEHPGGNRDSIVRYKFDSTNRLIEIEREGTAPIIVEYADAPHPQLAPALHRDHDKPGGMQLVNVETYIPGRPDLFEPDAILPRIQALTQQNAEEEQALVSATLATPSGQKQMQEAQRPDNGIFGWKSNRMALILTGMIVIAVGSLAWWKNRS